MRIEANAGQATRAHIASMLLGRNRDYPEWANQLTLPQHAHAGDLILRAESDKAAEKHGAWLKRSAAVDRLDRRGRSLHIALRSDHLATLAQTAVLTDAMFGRGTSERGHAWMIYSGNPNLNKALHIGHLRSLCLGEAIARMLSALGAEVVRGSIESDCGLHIAKVLVAAELLGEADLPRKPDHRAGALYQLYGTRLGESPSPNGSESFPPDRDSADGPSSSAARACEAMTLQWIRGDRDTRRAFAALCAGVMRGHDQTLAALGIQRDRRFLESAAHGRFTEMLIMGLKNGVFSRNADGSIVAELGTRRPTVVRTNGIPLHLGVIAAHNAIVADEYALHGTVGLEGNEFGDFLEVLTALIERLGFQKLNGSVLVNYGMVTHRGREVSSSHGTPPLIDEEIEALAARLADGSLSSVQARGRAIANLKFFVLAPNIRKPVAYDQDVLASGAAPSGIALLETLQRLANAETGPSSGAALTAIERSLMLEALRYPFVLDQAATLVEPHLLARAAVTLARRAEAVLRHLEQRGSAGSASRIALSAGFRALQSYLWMLHVSDATSMANTTPRLTQTFGSTLSRI